MNYLAKRLDAVNPSAPAAVSQNAKALKAEGHDVIDLGLGEPDFDTPAHIVEAAYQAAKVGEPRYPPTDGTAALKLAIIDKFKRDNTLSFSPSEVIVGNGAKQVIFDAFMATLENTSEVLLCAPYFGQYKDMVLILGGRPIVIDCPPDNGFRLTPELLEAAITPHTRWLLLNLPSNPSGTSYDEQQLSELGDVVRRHPHVLVMSDEVYEHITFDSKKHVSYLLANSDLSSQVLIVNGVSKAYAMTGWRIGYGAGSVPLIKGMTKVQSQISSGACSVAQAAATAALNGPQNSVALFKSAFEARRNLVVGRIKGINGLTLAPPDGAFYAYINCEHFIGATTAEGNALEDDTAFTAYILSEAKVAAVPGSAYGLSPFFRISTACSEDVLNIALDRIAAALSKLTVKGNTS